MLRFDMNALLALSLEDRLVHLRGDLAAMEVLWAREDSFVETFQSAARCCFGSNRREDFRIAARSFLDAIYTRFIAKPSDLVQLVVSSPGHLQVALLSDFVRSPLARNDVLFNLARLPSLFAQLERDAGWVEVVVFYHGAMLLNSFPDRDFTIADLLPLGVEADTSAARAVLSSALDSNQLAPTEKPSLLSFFPADAHFRRVLGRP